MAAADLNLWSWFTQDSTEAFSTTGTFSVQNVTDRTAYALKVNPADAAAGWNRFGGFSANGTSAVLGRTAETWYQFYFQVEALPSADTYVAQVVNSAGTRVVGIYITSVGALHLAAAGASASAGTLSTGVWYRINLRVTSNGTSHLSVDTGAEVSTTAANVTQDLLELGTPANSGSAVYYYDDGCIGSTEFVPSEYAIRYQRPNGDGTYTGTWAGGTGTTFTTVNQVVTDEDTTYIAATATGDNTNRSFTLAASIAATINPIISCKLLGRCRTDSISGSSTVGLLVRSGTTDSETTGREWTASYVTYAKMFPLDPNGSVAWTKTSIDAAQVGVFGDTLAQVQRCTQLMFAVLSVDSFDATSTLTTGAVTLSGTASAPSTYTATAGLAVGNAEIAGTAVQTPKHAKYVAHTADTGEGAVDGTTLTFSHTSSGSERALLVWVAVQENGTDNVVSGVTYNGVAMTELHQGESDTLRGALFGLVAPASGANNVVVSFSDNTWWAEVLAVSFENVHQTDPWDDTAFVTGQSTGSGQLQTATVTTEYNNELIVDFFAAQLDALIFIDPSQTARHNSSLTHSEGSVGFSYLSTYAPTPDDYDMSWSGIDTNLYHAHAALALRTSSYNVTSAGLTAGGTTLAGTATHTPPTYTGASAVTVGAATLSGSATFVMPTYTAAASLTSGAAVFAGTAAFTAPVYSASSSLTVGATTAAGTAEFDAPVYSATATLVVGAATNTGTAEFDAPVYSASSALTVGAATTAGTAEFDAPIYSATAALVVGEATAAGSATFSPGTKTASAAVTVGASTLAGSATFSPGTKTASATIIVGVSTLAGSATFSPGTKTASATLTVGAGTLAGSATFSPGTKTASAAVTVGASTVAGSATFSPGTKTASAALIIGTSTLAGSATFSPGTKTASATLIVGAATSTGTATFDAGFEDSTGFLLVGASTLQGTATHTAPVYTGTAALVTPVATFTATGTFTAAVYTATAALSAGSTTLAGSATFSPPIYTGNATLTAGNAELAASATFSAPQYTATSSLSTGAATFAGTGIFATEVYSASASLSVGSTAFAGSATTTTPTYTAVAGLSVAGTTASGSATFVAPVYTCSAALTTGSVVFTSFGTAGAITVTLGSAIATTGAVNAVISTEVIVDVGIALATSDATDVALSIEIVAPVVSADGLATDILAHRTAGVDIATAAAIAVDVDVYLLGTAIATAIASDVDILASITVTVSAIAESTALGTDLAVFAGMVEPGIAIATAVCSNAPRALVTGKSTIRYGRPTYRFPAETEDYDVS
jgi:hypothetical protein